MAQVSRAGSLLPPLPSAPPLRVPAGVSGQEPGELDGRRGPLVAGGVPWPGGGPAGERRWAGQEALDHGWEAAGCPLPPGLRRLRAELLRLRCERERLLRARACAVRLRASVRLLRSANPGSLRGSAGDLLPRGPAEAPEPGRLLGLAAQRLDAAIEMQLRVLGRAPAGPALAAQLSELLLALPAYHQLQGKAPRVPGAARAFPPARVLRLLAGERGSRVAAQLDVALQRLDLRDQLRRRCQEERELLPGLLGLLGGVAGAPVSGLGLGGAGALWGQYWTVLWAACAQSLDLRLGPWRDPSVAAARLSQALEQASLPQECEMELASLCHSLSLQSVIWCWDQGFCQALGSAHRDQSSHPTSWDGGGPSHTAQRLHQLLSPLLDTLQQHSQGLVLCRPPGPAPLALGLSTLQTTLLWFWGRAQQFLAAWAPGAFLLLIQKDLPPLLQEAQALSSLASEGSLVLDIECPLVLEIQKLTAQMQLLPEESLSIFSRECHKQALQGFELHMPRGRYWRPRLCPELPSVPSGYAGLVVRTVLEPVLHGLQGLPPRSQVPALGQALTAVLGAWLDHILAHRIRFSLQGALQLRQDFTVVRALLEEDQWGLPADLRQSLLTLSIFQQLDGALLCLLQQPLPRPPGRRRPPCCCACHDVQTSELPSSSLYSLESLEPPLRPSAAPGQPVQPLGAALRGGGPSPEAYLVGNQQAWLALRQHQHSRWHLRLLSCLGTSPDH